MNKINERIRLTKVGLRNCEKDRKYPFLNKKKALILYRAFRKIGVEAPEFVRRGARS